MIHDPLCPAPECDGTEFCDDSMDFLTCMCRCDLITAAYERGYKEAKEYYTNSCVSCGYAGEWSTWMCEKCESEE